MCIPNWLSKPSVTVVRTFEAGVTTVKPLSTMAETPGSYGSINAACVAPCECMYIVMRAGSKATPSAVGDMAASRL